MTDKEDSGMDFQLSEMAMQLLKRKAERRMSEEIECIVSSGNVFEDLGLPNAEELAKRSLLLWEIDQKLKAMKMPIAEKRRLLGVGATKYRNLVGGKISKFSLEDLSELKRRLLE